MSWHLSERVDEFAAHADDFLRTRPVQHTLLLTLVASLRARGPHVYGPETPIFGWWTAADGRVHGATLQTPPYPVLLSPMPADAVPALAEALADRPLPGVNAQHADAEAFAGAWQRRTGCRTRTGRRTRLFRLDALIEPDPPPGRARVADVRDRDLLIAWFDAFQAEIGEGRASRADLVDDRLGYGGLTLWETGGDAVAMAGASRPEAGMTRLAPVYTPREWRGRGYGGAVTAAVTRAALDAGATDVVLFTDLANRTSNALYQRLGYRPVEDRTVVEFTA